MSSIAAITESFFAIRETGPGWVACTDYCTPELKVRDPSGMIGKKVGRIEDVLSVSGASLVYAGYPTDPFA